MRKAFYFLGIVCSVCASFLIAKPLPAEWFWFGGICTVFIGLILHLRTQPVSYKEKDDVFAVREIIIVVILLSFSLIVRTIAVQSSPPFLHGDEAQCGNFGRLFNSGQAPLLSIGWADLPMFSYAISGIGLQLFGNTVAGFRLINGFVGTFCVLLTYLLGKELFTKRIGILSAYMLSFSFLMMDLSRDGIHYIQGPTFLLLTIYLCVKSLKTKNVLVAFAAGVSLIFDVQVYYSARIVFAIVPLLLFLFMAQRRAFRSYVHLIAWIIFGVVIAGLPIFSLFLSHPGTFSNRQNDVYIFNGNPGMMGELRAIYHTNDYKAILIGQTIRTVTTFINRGDASTQIGWSKGILDPITTVLFLSSLFYGMANVLKKWQYLFCILWISFGIAAGIMTVDPPWWPRLVVVFPAVYILIGGFLDGILHLFDTNGRYKKFAIVCVFMLLLIIAAYNIHEIFVDYPTATSHKDRQVMLIGAFLENNPEAKNTVFISDGKLFLDQEAIRFLAPQAAGCTVTRDDILSQCPNAESSKLFIVLPTRAIVIPYLRKVFPGGRTISIGPDNSPYGAIAYER